MDTLPCDPTCEQSRLGAELYLAPGLVRPGDRQPLLLCAGCFARLLGRAPGPAERVVLTPA